MADDAKVIVTILERIAKSLENQTAATTKSTPATSSHPSAGVSSALQETSSTIKGLANIPDQAAMAMIQPMISAITGIFQKVGDEVAKATVKRIETVTDARAGVSDIADQYARAGNPLDRRQIEDLQRMFNQQADIRQKSFDVVQDVQGGGRGAMASFTEALIGHEAWRKLGMFEQSAAEQFEAMKKLFSGWKTE